MSLKKLLARIKELKDIGPRCDKVLQGMEEFFDFTQGYIRFDYNADDLKLVHQINEELKSRNQ